MKNIIYLTLIVILVIGFFYQKQKSEEYKNLYNHQKTISQNLADKNKKEEAEYLDLIEICSERYIECQKLKN